MQTISIVRQRPLYPKNWADYCIFLTWLCGFTHLFGEVSSDFFSPRVKVETLLQIFSGGESRFSFPNRNSS